MGKIAIAQITIADLSDPIISGSAPSNPVNDMLWLDTSVSPNVLKRYSNGAWVVVNDTSSLVERITTAEQKITDDAIVSTVRTSTQYKNDLSGKVDNSKLEEYSTIKQTSDAITSAVSGVQVGGRNLLRNSSFSENFDGWNVNYTTGSLVTTDMVTVDGYKCAHISGAAGDAKHSVTIRQNILDKIENDPVGQMYSYSADVKVVDYVPGPSRPYLALIIDGYYRKDDGTLAWNGGRIEYTLQRFNNLGWQRASFHTSLLHYPPVKEFRVQFYGRDFTGDVYFKNLKLERGNKATDWTPAPEDTDGKIDTITNSVSQVKQTADKINWLVASGDSASNMQMTSEAYTLISENITLTADKINAVADDINLAGNKTVKITSADQITAEAAKNIDLSANESVKVTAAKINAVADDIDLSGNDTVHISSADQIDISAVNDLNLSSNGTISLIAGRVDDLEDDAIYDSATPPATAVAGKKWLDRGVVPAQLRRWKGLTATPNGGTMTTAREIEESASGRVISLDNSGNQIDGTLSVVVQGFNLLPLNKNTFSITSKGVTMVYNGNGSFTFTGTATADESFVISNKDTICHYRFYYPQDQLVASTRCSNYPTTGGITFSVRDADDWTLLADFPATNGQYQAFTGDGKEALIFFFVGSGTAFGDGYTVYPQIQVGSTATAFTPYKNTASVIRCGKNMLDIFALCNGFSGAQGGTVGKYPESGGFDLTATANDMYTNPWNGANYDIPVKPNTTYTLSWDIYKVPSTGTSAVMYFIDHRFETGYYGQAAYDTHKLTFTTPSDAKSVSFRFGVQNSGESVGYANLQLELGSARTTFETYSGVTTEVPLAIDAYHGWNVEIESQSGLNNILTSADAMSIEYDCSGWETIGDTSELQRTVDQNTLDAARIEAIANEADQLSKENAANFKRVVEIQEGADGGLIVGDNLSNCSIKIKSASIELRVNNTAVATYAQDYVRLQDMQIRVPSGVGGLVLSKFG